MWQDTVHNAIGYLEDSGAERFKIGNVALHGREQPHECLRENFSSLRRLLIISQGYLVSIYVISVSGAFKYLLECIEQDVGCGKEC